MRRGPPSIAILLAGAIFLAVANAQNPGASRPAPKPADDEDYHVYTDAPRLFLTKARLRLLQRERERQSARWQQFEVLITGGAPMPERGFAYGLYYRVSTQAVWGRQGIDWALSEAARADRPEDLRQLAIVYDWCALTPAESDRLGAKIEKALAAAPARSATPETDTARESVRALAAIAIADRLADHGESILKPIVNEWWRRDLVPRLESGAASIPHNQSYAFMEMLHALRDNLRIDLRDDAPGYFKSFGTEHLVSHYPAAYNAPENEFRVPAYVRDGDPDLGEMVRSRSAELAMVAYDSNAADTQLLQGWLMQNRFVMHGALGAPYEFLWANPYQPGLSYFQVPLVFHDGVSGRLFARTSWDEDATWIGYFDGHLQLYRDGSVQSLKAGASAAPVHVGEAEILTATDREKDQFRVDGEAVFVLGLAPHARYDVEIDDQELSEEQTDNGGTMVLSIPEGIETGVRLKKRAE